MLLVLARTSWDSFGNYVKSHLHHLPGVDFLWDEIFYYVTVYFFYQGIHKNYPSFAT